MTDKRTTESTTGCDILNILVMYRDTTSFYWNRQTLEATWSKFEMDDLDWSTGSYGILENEQVDDADGIAILPIHLLTQYTNEGKGKETE